MIKTYGWYCALYVDILQRPRVFSGDSVVFVIVMNIKQHQCMRTSFAKTVSHLALFGELSPVLEMIVRKVIQCFVHVNTEIIIYAFATLSTDSPYSTPTNSTFLGIPIKTRRNSASFFVVSVDGVILTTGKTHGWSRYPRLASYLCALMVAKIGRSIPGDICKEAMHNKCMPLMACTHCLINVYALHLWRRLSR